MSRAWEQLAALPLDVSGYAVERLERAVSSGFVRVSTVVRLEGRDGAVGVGEDVTYDAEDHEDYPRGLPLAGSFTLASFSALLGELEAAGPPTGFTADSAVDPAEHLSAMSPGGAGLFSRPPLSDMSRQHRRWAFESAALDLALRQSRLSLGAAVDLPYRPLRFVVSTRLDIRPWLALYPELEFKLDPTPDWDDELVERIAATGAVRVVDFKGYYRGTPVDVEPDPALYARVVRRFPDAIVEDAAVTGATCSALGDSLERLSWDAPIHSWADVELMARVTALDVPRYLNIKPSRFGTAQALFDCIGRAQERGITLYGGGQFELGPGRSQVQALASLFYADAPNDVAPSGFNELEPAPGLPHSPLSPPARPLGLSFDAAG